MRILFIGSVPDNDYDRSPGAEGRAVRAHRPLWLAMGDLGRVAAERGHTIMVGSNRKTTIDHHVVTRGLFAVAKATPGRRFFLEVYRPNDTRRPFEDKLPANVHGLWYCSQPGFPAETKPVKRARRRPGTPRWLFAHQSAITSADVVIVAGGTHGTRTAALTAKTLGVPVLPISSFGGGAAGSDLPRPDDDRAHHLSADWPDDRRGSHRTQARTRADGIVQLAEAVGLHSYFLSHSHRELPWCDLVHLTLFDHGRTAIRDRNQLRAGRPVQKKLYEAIGRAETFVMLWSRHSAASEWCRKELQVAVKLHRQGLPPHRIVLLMGDDTPLPEAVAHCLQLDVASADANDARILVDRAVIRMLAEERFTR